MPQEYAAIIKSVAAILDQSPVLIGKQTALVMLQQKTKTKSHFCK
jgi:hypothetical protein